MQRSVPFVADGDRDDPSPRAAWAIVALLAVLHAVPFFVAFVEGDFARDLYAALRIAQGRDWPLEGPVISWTVHLGPVWYYALAIPMKLGGSLTAVVAAIAVASALQFPLAYRLGSEAFDRRTGLAWAILLAMPGVGSLASLWIAHPSVTATLVLGVLYALRRAHAASSPAWLAAAGAAFGLALHAHPTTLPLALPLAWVAIASARKGGTAGVAGAVAALVLAAAPFLPLLANLRAHADDALRMSQHMSSDMAVMSAAAIARVFAGAVWRVSDVVVGTWLAGDGRPLAAWRATAAALYLLAAAGWALLALRGPPRWRRAALAIAIAFVAWMLFVAAIRGVTRFYMLYAPLPLFALALALGVRGLALHGGAAGRLAGRALLAGVVAWALAATGARVARALADDVRVPPLLGAHDDLQRSDARASYTRLHYLSVRHLDAIGRRLCVDGRVHAFAELAQVVDTQFNVAAQIRCGDASRVVIGGTPAPGDRAYFLLQRDALEPRMALRDFGGFGFGRVDEVLVPRPALPLARGDDYPPRKGCGKAVRHDLAFETSRASTLVVASGLAVTCPMRVVRLERDGAPAEVSMAADSAWTRAPDGPARWTLVVETGAPEALQVFTVARPAGGASPATP